MAIAFAVTVAGAVAVMVVIPRVTHGQAMTVLTGSMTPSIPVGSVVVVRPVDPGTLRVGDVATYQRERGKAVFVTHRVVGIDSSRTPTRFTFKGDANRGPDLDPVVPQQIRGEVWFHLPYLGAVRDGLHGKGGISLLLMLLLAGYALSQVGAGLRDRRGEVAGPPVELPLDRHLLVVTLDLDRLTSHHALSPAQAAARWGGLVVHEDGTMTTLVLTATSTELSERLAMLEVLRPSRIQVVNGRATLTGDTTSPLLGADEDDRVGA